MVRPLDFIPGPVTGPSLVVTTPLPAYRAPRHDASPWARSRLLAGGGPSLGGDHGVVDDPEAPFDAATSTAVTPASPTESAPSASSNDGCGCS